MTTKYLRIYLNDHRAGALAGLELVKRARSSNQGTELGEYLLSFEAEVREDLRALEEAMRSLGVPLNQIKAGAAWLAEKLGRAKLNGQVRGYSPLSRLIELEGLGLAVEGKRRLWTTLERLAERDARESGPEIVRVGEAHALDPSTHAPLGAGGSAAERAAEGRERVGAGAPMDENP